MLRSRMFGVWRTVATVGTLALFVLAISGASAQADEPIVGFWQITTKDKDANVIDHTFAVWTSDGLEIDQDVSPILIENACYGKWIKLKNHTYGLTHPFFNFMDPNVNGEGTEATEGQWDGTSATLSYTVNVSNDGKSFTGKAILRVFSGPDPYDPGATVLLTITGWTLSATRIEVDKSQLP